MLQYWLLVIDTNFCTADDLRLDEHGWNYDLGGYAPAACKNDLAVLFDCTSEKFLTLGTFRRELAITKDEDSNLWRYDFWIKVSNKRESKRALADVKKSLNIQNHLLNSADWQSRVLSPLKREEFDDLIHAWWGIDSFSELIEDNRDNS
jgi:hypothetical protein